MKVEEHEQAYQEHVKNLNNAIEEGISENQRNIGYNISQGSVELLAIYLHKLRLFQGSGDQLDHRIFKNKNLIEKKISPEFISRNKILELMRIIETERNLVCYGKRKSEEKINIMIKAFQELRRIINENLKEKKNGNSK
jgi:hypothetical protein